MYKNKKGFTLIEIIVVIVILAVLLAVAVPAVLKYINEADDAKFMTSARGTFNTLEPYYSKLVLDEPESQNDFNKFLTDKRIVIGRDSFDKPIKIGLKSMLSGFYYNLTDYPDVKEEIAGSYKVGDYELIGIDLYFDGLNSGESWAFDKNQKTHNISKYILRYYSSKTRDTKWVVCIVNSGMKVVNSTQYDEYSYFSGNRTEWSIHTNLGG